MLNLILDTPLKKEWSLSVRPGHLRLYGGSYGLSSPESPTMLLRKQTDFNQIFQATLDFQPSHPGYEAGIVVWYSMYSYASIGIKIVSHETGERTKSVVTTLPTSDIGVTSVSWQTDSGELLTNINQESIMGTCSQEPLTLSIHCNDLGYTLSYQEPETKRKIESKVQAEILTRSPPMGGNFTGVMLGIYCFGKAGPCLDPADFSDICLGS